MFDPARGQRKSGTVERTNETKLEHELKDQLLVANISACLDLHRAAQFGTKRHPEQFSGSVWTHLE